MTVTVIALSVLATFTVLKWLADRQKRKAFASLAQDVKVTSSIVRVLALHQASGNDVLRSALTASLEETRSVCADCPFHRSSLCNECGRYAAGDVPKSSSTAKRS